MIVELPQHGGTGDDVMINATAMNVSVTTTQNSEHNASDQVNRVAKQNLTAKFPDKAKATASNAAALGEILMVSSSFSFDLGALTSTRRNGRVTTRIAKLAYANVDTVSSASR